MELRTRYWSDPASRAAFQRFMITIFGLDFSRWEAAGYWDEAYTPFSFFEGDEVMASVCAYLLPARLRGRDTHLLQISGVGTLAEHRRRGLNRELTEIALDWAEGRHEGVFLFSSPGAVDFYDRCGFLPVEEFLCEIEVSGRDPRPGLRPVSQEQPGDLEQIFQRVSEREPVSEVLSLGTPRLWMFHLLYGMGPCLHEVPELETLVLLEREGSRLRLFDVVAPRMPRFEDLYPYLASPGDEVVEFHFSPDRLGLGDAPRRAIQGNHPFVREGFPLEEPIFPATSRA